MEQQIIINQNENQVIDIGNNLHEQTINLNQNNIQEINVNNNLNTQTIGLSQNENQLIYINGGGVAIGINDVLVNGVSVVSNNIAYVIVPTKTSDLINDSGYITTETDPTVPSYVKAISLGDINNWNNKQNALVSGSTIKTINNESLLGSGNIEITGTEYTAGDGIDITNDVISNTITSYNDLTDLPTIPTTTSDLINDSDFVSENELAEVAFTGGYGSLSNTPEYTSDFINDGDGTHKFISDYSSQNIKGLDYISNKWGIVNGDNLLFNALQDELVSGTNIKTINNESLLGSGNISISGGSATDVQVNGTSITSGGVANIITESAYDSSTNKILTKTDIDNVAKTNVNNSFTSPQTLPSLELKNSQPYIDFHYNNDMTVDFTSRIIEGTSGTLTIPGNLDVTGNLTKGGTNVQLTLDFKLETYGTTTGANVTYTPDSTSGVWIIIGQIWGGVNDNAGIYMINPITGAFTNINTIVSSSYISVSYSGGVITINKLGGSSLNYKIIRVLTSYAS